MHTPLFSNALIDEPMCKHTTFGVGGPAAEFVVPESRAELADVVARCREAGVAYFILGKGSDLLVSDNGFDGVVIALDALNGVRREGVRLHCDAGASLVYVSRRALYAGLTGMEFACGIPGSIGGACFMNAGAYDGCMADVLESVDVITPDGEFSTLMAGELDMGYRKSRVRSEGLVVLGATVCLTEGDRDAIRAKMDDFTQRREEKQPLEYGSAGSTFKRPEGYFAGKLIMDAGLKGYQVGGAAVSTKHAGFVVNLGGATATDVRAVIEHVQDEVERQFGVRLEPEVRFLGW